MVISRMSVPLAALAGLQGAKRAALLFAAGIVPCGCAQRRGGKGRVLPTLPSGEGGSKTPFSSVLPPSGTQSTRDVLSAERLQQCQPSDTHQAAEGSAAEMQLETSALLFLSKFMFLTLQTREAGLYHAFM